MILDSPRARSSFAKQSIFTNSARTGLRLLLAGINITKQKGILIPSYVGFSQREGSGIKDPIVNSGITFAFYELNLNLKPNYLKLEELMKSSKYSSILVVHYFGIIQFDMPKIKQLCMKYSIALIEDCAHVPWSIDITGGIGNWGIASIFSVHKSIGVKSGGVLRINDPDLEIPMHLNDSEKMQTKIKDLMLSTDMAAVSTRRKANYKFLADLLTKVEDVELLFPKISSEVPLNLPVLIKHGLREKLYFSLLAKKVKTTALYYKLIDDISQIEYPESHYLSNHILNLPIHQDLDKSELTFLAKTIASEIVELKS